MYLAWHLLHARIRTAQTITSRLYCCYPVHVRACICLVGARLPPFDTVVVRLSSSASSKGRFASLEKKVLDCAVGLAGRAGIRRMRPPYWVRSTPTSSQVLGQVHVSKRHHGERGIHNFAVRRGRGTIAGLASWPAYLLSVLSTFRAGNTRHEMGSKLQEASSCAALHWCKLCKL